MATTLPNAVGVAHPLDPLTVDEIAAAVDIVRTERQLSARVRFVSVTLHEPAKAVVLAYPSVGAVDREAFAILLDNEAGQTYEAVISLSRRTVLSWEHVPNVQPAIMLDEFLECEQACKASPEWQAAMRKRGITNFDLCMVDPWSAGNFGLEAETGRRLSRALTWVRSRPDDNGYARPVENVITVVDLHAMEVIAVEDFGVVPLPPEEANYSAEIVGARTDLKPIEIHQPEGPSFVVDGHDVRWQKWHFRVGFTPREGLVLHTISYADHGRERPIIYRASLADMLVPYGDPRPAYFRRNAFDVGEYGIGMLANSLEQGCDCLGEIHYFDVAGHDSHGQPMTIPNAICMHEEDNGLLWKHIDWRNGYSESRRSRRLVISFIATVGNYEYGFFWYFNHPARSEVNWRDLERGDPAWRGATLGHARGPAGIRSHSPALLQRAARHDGRWVGQLGLRGQHRGRSERAGQSVPQRVPCRGYVARDGVQGAASDRSVVGTLLDHRQPNGPQPFGTASRVQADARRKRPTVRARRREHSEAWRVRHQASVGNAV